MRATEWTESLRDLVTTIVETNLTEQGNRMNLIMKKVTSWAAIIAVPTAITGWYGQNVPYPGFGKTSGVIASTVLIVGLAVGLFVLFRRKDWLYGLRSAGDVGVIEWPQCEPIADRSVKTNRHSRTQVNQR